ncbi:MAG: ribose 5-phosphate isomerase B [Thermoanaerobaculia bacterium]|nr:ribose 5-phosphate isomerase B [Thermoanaerobaculia bacterium]
MKIATGADHAGYELKDHLAAELRGSGHEVDDVGTSSGDSVDYPDFAAAVGRKVASGEVDLGVLVCGSGLGVAIAANKIRGVRAATCNDPYSAAMSRAHNDANVLTIGARIVGEGLAEEILRAFLSTEFEGGRHGRRVGKITALED